MKKSKRRKRRETLRGKKAPLLTFFNASRWTFFSNFRRAIELRHRSIVASVNLSGVRTSENNNWLFPTSYRCSRSVKVITCFEHVNLAPFATEVCRVCFPTNFRHWLTPRFRGVYISHANLMSKQIFSHHLEKSFLPSRVSLLLLCENRITSLGGAQKAEISSQDARQLLIEWFRCSVKWNG